MKKNVKKKILLSMATMTTVSSLCGSAAFAFGVHTGGNTWNNELPANSAYQNWYNESWNNQAEQDSGKIILTPGKTEKDINFAWYSEAKGNPQIKIATKSDMTDADVFLGNAQSIDKSNGFHSYKAANKVAVENYLKENTTYYYQYSIDGNQWSDMYTYQTHSFSSFQAVLVGDPQIGASGSNGQGTNDDIDIAVNTFAWNQTLTKALGENGIADKASFILSAGDQIDYSEANNYQIREQEYAGYLYPSYLRSVPVATTIGNHESKGDDYKYHYNNPNASSLGQTESGGDYYYSYGDTLIISLNSNSRNVAEHRQLLQEAVNSHQDAKWRIVMFHHDIYGAGSPHSNIDGANLRILFAPLMDEFHIDVCLTGHDHSYARTYQILDGKVISTDGVSENTSTAYNPEGTLYIAAGSATGSKFYDLTTDKQYYLAERSNNPIPTFSTLDFSENELTIKTYDYQGNKYAFDVTLKKDQNQTSINELKTELNTLKNEKITSGSKQRIDDALTNVNDVLESKDDTKAINELQGYWNSLNDPLDYYAYAKEGYKDPNSKALKQGYSSLLDKTLYEADENKAVSQSNLKQLYDQMMNAKNEMVTEQEFISLQSQFDDAEKLLTTIEVGDQKGQYSKTAVDAYQKVIKQLKIKLNESTITHTELVEVSDTLKLEKDKLLSSVNKEDTVHVSDEQKPGSENQQIQETGNKNQSVKTGDTTQFADMIMMMVMSLTGLISYIFYRRKLNK